MSIRTHVWLPVVLGLLCWAGPAQAATVQDAGDILFDGSAFLLVEGEDASVLGGDPATRFITVNKENPIQTRTVLPNGDPVVKGGLDVLPADTNAFGGAAVFDQIGGAFHDGTVTYDLQFAHPGTYFTYFRYSLYNSDGNTNYSNEDSVFLPPAFNKNAKEDWIGFEGVDENGDPKTGDSVRDGWMPLFKDIPDGGEITTHNTTTEDFWDGTFHWNLMGVAVDVNADNGFIDDFGQGIQYDVTQADVGTTLTYQFASREHYGAIDAILFSTSNTLLEDFTQNQLTQLVHGVVGDMDLNGAVDFDDIGPFVLGLNDPVEYETQFGLPPVVKGDIDGNGSFDFDDIAGFVSILTGDGEPSVVPEPTTGVLAILATGIALVGSRRRRRRRSRRAKTGNR